MKQKFLLCLISLMLTAFIFSSCKSNRHLIKTPIKEQGSEYLFEHLKKNEFKFNTFAAKFRVEYSIDKQYFDFKGQVRIVKDSLIWITFKQDLGLEIGRLLITRDSVKFINRLKKEYFIGDYTFVNNFLNTNIDFGILQSIILGNDFEYYEQAEFKASVDGRKYRLSTISRNKLKKYVRNTADAERILLQSIWLDPDSFKITSIKLKELTRNSKKLSATYTGFEPIDQQLFPFKINYQLEADIPVSVEVEYTRIDLNQEISAPFHISSKYSPSY